MKYHVQKKHGVHFSGMSHVNETQNAYPEKKEEIHVRIITDEKAFTDMEPEWNALEAKARVSIYSTYDWLFCWWRHFGRHPDRELFIIAIFLDEKLIGIVPFYRGFSRVGTLIIQRRLYLMGGGTEKNEFVGYTKDYGYSDFLDMIIHPGFEQSAAKIISALFDRHTIDADEICLLHVNDDSFIMRHLIPALEQQKIAFKQKKTDLCPRIKLPSSMKTFIKQTGPSARRRKLRKNLKAAGKKYSVKKATSEKEVQKGLETLIFLHQKRWNSLGYPGVFYDDRHQLFVEEISKILFQKNKIWFKFASDKDGISAARLAIKHDNRFYDWLSGFDDSAPSAKARPGLGLLANMIEEAIDAGAAAVELMRGGERYKFDFTEEATQNRRITIPLYDINKLAVSAKHNALKTVATCYFMIARELELLNVQRRQAGFGKMFFSYGAFRYRSLNK